MLYKIVSTVFLGMAFVMTSGPVNIAHSTKTVPIPQWLHKMNEGSDPVHVARRLAVWQEMHQEKQGDHSQRRLSEAANAPQFHETISRVRDDTNSLRGFFDEVIGKRQECKARIGDLETQCSAEEATLKECSNKIQLMIELIRDQGGHNGGHHGGDNDGGHHGGGVFIPDGDGSVPGFDPEKIVKDFMKILHDCHDHNAGLNKILARLAELIGKRPGHEDNHDSLFHLKEFIGTLFVNPPGNLFPDFGLQIPDISPDSALLEVLDAYDPLIAAITARLTELTATVKALKSQASSCTTNQEKVKNQIADTQKWIDEISTANQGGKETIWT